MFKYEAKTNVPLCIFLLHSESEPARRCGAGILKQSMGARNRVGIGLLYRPAMLHRLAELIPWLHKCLKIRAMYSRGWEPSMENKEHKGVYWMYTEYRLSVTQRPYIYID